MRDDRNHEFPRKKRIALSSSSLYTVNVRRSCVTALSMKTETLEETQISLQHYFHREAASERAIESARKQKNEVFHKKLEHEHQLLEKIFREMLILHLMHEDFVA
jgi:hypothetical protein